MLCPKVKISTPGQSLSVDISNKNIIFERHHASSVLSHDQLPEFEIKKK